jgi:hypothetical protein
MVSKISRSLNSREISTHTSKFIHIHCTLIEASMFQKKLKQSVEVVEIGRRYIVSGFEMRLLVGVRRRGACSHVD